MKKEYKIITFFLVGLLVTKSFLMFAEKEGFLKSDFLTSIINQTNITMLTNEARREEGVPILKISKRLATAAQQKADDMLAKNYFSHETPDGKTPWDFIRANDYDYLHAGENLALYFTSAEDATEGWMTSPTHRANIVSENFTEIGIGIAHGRFQNHETTLIVQMFGKPLGNLRGAALSNEKIKPAKKRMRVLAKISEPTVKGIATTNGAVWFPQTTVQELFGSTGSSILRDIFGYGALLGALAIAYRFVKKRYARSWPLSLYTLLVFALGTVLTAL